MTNVLTAGYPVSSEFGTGPEICSTETGTPRLEYALKFVLRPTLISVWSIPVESM